MDNPNDPGFDEFPPCPGPPHGGPGLWFGPPHHHGPHGPPPPGSPQGPPPPGWPFGPPGPPPLLTKEAFQEIKHLFVLMIIQDAPDGITGYQLQEKYDIPRGNLIRTLDELEENKYVSTREAVENGRNLKYYTITAEGKAYVEKLKEEWANRFAMLSEIAPPDIHGNPFMREGPKRRMFKNIEKFTSKEDALDYFHGVRSMLKSVIARIQERLKRTEDTKANIDSIIQEIEKMDSFDLAKIKDLIQKVPREFGEPETP